MSCWRIIIALLMLSQIVMAEEELTAEQVIQRWIKEQREHPVSQVKFSCIEINQKFLKQTNRLGELTYTSETSGQYRLIPWPSTMKQLSVRRGYELFKDEWIFDMSWNESTVFFRDNDGTVQELPRPAGMLHLFKLMDFVSRGLPPVFPGPVDESRIAKYDWSITKREPDSIWLRGLANDKKEKGTYAPTWEVIIDTDSWRVRAARRLDSSHNNETVMVIRRD